ncbi:hypothetical protein FHJ30_18105 [Arthrobacter sp. BB-1]|uniref:hypothetical protein n=1 Tax=unclassified Arthrobacter TaxID=235627 RepID=UPI0011123FDE|nr:MULTISPECIES: hypothetical protein [unclassified Arthrobacter]TNB69503.1 hypothetical protein FHJ30_18105 [Arthrobacter sp. BB-1]
MLEFDGFGSGPGFERGELGFHPLGLCQPFQADLVGALQGINPCTGRGCRVQGSVLKEQRVKGTDGGVNALHHHCSPRCDPGVSPRAVSHRNIL